ncbi:hypothetical protein PMI05_01839 [Brevibacillus sp. BC25]|nr:hypothetical protein PMI05_01839 [Brevibacillus sp. BC25]
MVTKKGDKVAFLFGQMLIIYRKMRLSVVFNFQKYAFSTKKPGKSAFSGQKSGFFVSLSKKTAYD